jgi:hypothetical protein
MEFLKYLYINNWPHPFNQLSRITRTPRLTACAVAPAQAYLPTNPAPPVTMWIPREATEATMSVVGDPPAATGISLAKYADRIACGT